MIRQHSPAFTLALARLNGLIRETVPAHRHREVSNAVAKFTAAAVREDRARHAGGERLRGESRAVFDEIFGDDGLFDKVFGTAGGRR